MGINLYVDVSIVRLWVRLFKQEEVGEATFCDKPKSGRRTVTATDEPHQEIIPANSRNKQKNIAVKVGISKQETMGHSISLVGLPKICASWAPHELTDDMKDEQVRVSKKILSLFEVAGDVFLQRIVTGGGSVVHHCDPEKERLSVEYCHKGSPAPTQYKTKDSA